jgi:hypothetical protein
VSAVSVSCVNSGRAASPSTNTDNPSLLVTVLVLRGIISPFVLEIHDTAIKAGCQDLVSGIECIR